MLEEPLTCTLKEKGPAFVEILTALRDRGGELTRRIWGDRNAREY